jgi:hypothetical protein
MNYNDLEQSRRIAEDHMQALEHEANQNRLLAANRFPSPESGSKQKRGGLLQWLLSLRRSRPQPTAEAEEVYRRRMT